ncbi:MAG: hypothetical protein U0573_01975 [Phycisphaerales bacterium]|nr:hypothetical protein [Planctomycetota bacterium]
MNCGRCLYDLRELRADRCPECGVLLSECPPVDQPFLQMNAKLAQRYALGACGVVCLATAAGISVLPNVGVVFMFTVLVVFVAGCMISRVQSRGEGVDLWPRDLMTGCVMVPFLCVVGVIPGLVLGSFVLWIRWKLHI